MSSKERSKSRRAWGCKNPAGCGAIFDGARTIAAAPVKPGQPIPRGASPTTLICPICNTYHFFTADGRGVRLLTPVETAELFRDVPQAAREFQTRAPARVGLAELHVIPVEE